MQNSLIEAKDSVLIVIDVQDRFLARLGASEREQVLDRINWLVDVATRLDIPLVVTAEDIGRNGSVAPRLAARLPPGTPIYDKVVFGLVGQPDVYASVQSTGRRTAILIGLETDVCVAQSAIGLVQEGYRVVVVADATGSPGGAAHEAGLERIRLAGAVISSVKGLYYEWIRNVKAMREFAADRGHDVGEPKGIIL